MRAGLGRSTLASLMLVIAAFAVVFAYPREFVLLVLVINVVSILPMIFLMGLALIDQISRMTSAYVTTPPDQLSGGKPSRDMPAVDGSTPDRDGPR